jgi:hypothetical protein
MPRKQIKNFVDFSLQNNFFDGKIFSCMVLGTTLDGNKSS